MLKGIPYWGESTFKDREIILSKVKAGKITDIAYENIDIFSVCKTLFKHVVIINNKWLTWGKDIRFDYRDKLVFIPYFTYDTKLVNSKCEHKHLNRKDNMIDTHYNFQMYLYPLYSYTASYKNFEIIYADIKTLEVYRINLNNLPFLVEPFSIKTLYKDYINACYYDEDWEAIDFKNNYHWIQSEKGLNKESSIRSGHNLPTWKLGDKIECTPLVKRVYNYCDIRLYDLNTLETVYTFDFDRELQYFERRYLFEAYLLCGVLEGLEFVEEQEQKKWNMLGNQLEYFKYIESDMLPMYMKHYYTLHDNLKRKSYEHYETISNIKDLLE